MGWNWVMAAAQALSIAIDPVAWTQVQRIGWPGESHRVEVIQPVAGVYRTGCGDLPAASRSDGQHSFRMGEYCKQLVVLMDLSAGTSDPQLAEAFLARHEAFHVAAQMYGSKIPLEFLEIEPSLVERFAGSSAFQPLFAEVDALLAALDSGGELSCPALVGAYRALADDERRYLDYKMFWEWPAEFYAQQTTFGSDTGSYERFRSGLFSNGNEGFELFVAGVKAGLILDRIMGREAWQKAVAEGGSMFDLVMATAGCAGPERGVRVRMRRVELL